MSHLDVSQEHPRQPPAQASASLHGPHPEWVTQSPWYLSVARLTALLSAVVAAKRESWR